MLVIFPYYKLHNSNKRSLSQSQILGFQVNGIGNGHLTQAETVYKVLIKNYKIPIVIIYGRTDGYCNIFPESKVIYHKIESTQESINNMNLWKAIKDIILIKPTRKFENEHGINKWFNFYVSDFFNFRTKQICIANHFSVDNIINDLLMIISKLLSNVTCVSVHLPSKHCKYTIPPLINLEKIKRKNVNKQLLLAYSVSGQDFPKRLNYIAKKNPSYQFKFFTNTKIEEKLSKNISVYKPDKIHFDKYLQFCGAVLSTSGNQLILECILNEIPCATMPCSIKQFEQVHNLKKYVNNLKYCDYFSNSLDLEYLVNKNMKESSLNLTDSLKNRDEKILKLCNI